MAILTIDRETATVRGIYSDDTVRYIERLRAEFGLPKEAVKIERASHVEPLPHCGSRWFVDLSPVGGPEAVLEDEEGQPFTSRSSALAYERRWLEHNWLNAGRREAHVGT